MIRAVDLWLSLLNAGPSSPVTVTLIRALIFFPDGERAEVSDYPADVLSEKWLKFCAAILDTQGPVFEHNLGGSLAHFEIEMGGAIGEFLCYGHCQFEVAILTGKETPQNEAALNHFIKICEARCGVFGQVLSDDTRRQFRGVAAVPSVLIFDRIDAECPEEQKAALAQLALHFAAAYLNYVCTDPAAK